MTHAIPRIPACSALTYASPIPSRSDRRPNAAYPYRSFVGPVRPISDSLDEDAIPILHSGARRASLIVEDESGTRWLFLSAYLFADYLSSAHCQMIQQRSLS